MFKLLLLIFVCYTNALNIIDFVDFELMFYSNCREYFLFNGTDYYAYFHEVNGKFELQLNHHAGNYATYTGVTEDTTVVFTWGGFLLNHQPMNLSSYKGEIQLPMRFHTERIFCGILNLRNGSFLRVNNRTESNEASLTYKCNPNRNWLLVAFIGLVVALYLIAAITKGDESGETLSRPTIFRCIQWSQQILSRSEENSSSRYDGSSQEDSR